MTPVPICGDMLVVVAGDHAVAQAPEQADVVPLSASKAYRVKPRPSVRIVPRDVLRTARAAPPPAGADPVDGLGAAPPYRGPPPGLAADGLQAARVRAPAAATAGRARTALRRRRWVRRRLGVSMSVPLVGSPRIAAFPGRPPL